MKRAIVLSSVMVTLLVAGSALADRTIYVDDDAAGANDGSSWENAYNYLQDALADADSGAKPAQIRVAQGIYKPHQHFHADLPDMLPQMQFFQLISGVALRGGYAGSGKLAPDARDIHEHETILSGDLEDNDVSLTDPCDLQDEPTRLDNSYRVVLAYRVDQTAVMDGFTITGGHDKSVGVLPGGGAGMVNFAASPTIINCTFHTNDVLDCGGAIFSSDDSSPALINCLFQDNYGGSGGAIASYDSDGSLTLTNCAFVGNRANGGAAISSAGNKRLTLINCTFMGNAAKRGTTLSHSRIQYGIVKNCILWDDGNEISDNPDSELEVTYSNIQGGWPGAGNIDADPLFADPDNGDYHLKSQAGRWDPNSSSWVQDDVTSPCIDAGDPKSPIGHEPFPHGGIANMGAHGGTTEASKSYFDKPVCETIVAGDINGDCAVDIKDFVIMARHWLEQPDQLY